MICSQTTGERLASSVASYSLVRLTLAYSKGREVSAADGGVGSPVGGGGGGEKGGSTVGEATMGGVYGCTGPLRPEHVQGWGLG